MVSACVSALCLLFNFWDEGSLLITIDWFTVGRTTFTANLAISNQSMVMLGAVSFISLLVHLYSIGYMAGDPAWKRYFAILGFFTFAMQGIVLSDNMLLVFVFWELVGFSSYMLIGHWTRKPEAGRAATKAFVMNRIGDAGFLVGLMIIWATWGTFSVSELLQAPPTEWQTAAALCIFCGVIGKSAQVPLTTWLPDAMEGPTPVSALIHAATMVAAGVYLLVRLFGIFTADALLVVAITGMVTTVAGALAALSQYDIKKILAYSTISQLGLMVLAIGMGVAEAALLHLIAHAFFKACLFLCAGMIIHSIHQAQPAGVHFDPQDIRNMGGLKDKLPLVFICFLISGASLAGVPFFSGFLSKEAIITALFMHSDVTSWMMIAVILAVSFLTVLYTFRMIWFVFFGTARTIRSLELRQPSWVMRLPAILLSVGSLWLLVSWNPFDFKGWMLPRHPVSAHALSLTLLSALWVAGAMLLAWMLFKGGNFRTSNLLRNAFYFDDACAWLARNTVHRTSATVRFVDKHVIDKGLHGVVYAQVTFSHILAGIDRIIIDGTVNAMARLVSLSGAFTRSFQGGNIQLYIFWAVFAIIIFIISSLY
jgi:NADH-quinone oxidoreductase subunit L